MRVALASILAASCLAEPALAQPKKDAPNCKDHSPFTRLQGYWIESCVQKRDAYNFDAGKSRNKVDGEYWYIRYQPPAGLTSKPSTAELLQRLNAEIEKAGGELVAADSSKKTYTLQSAGKETWVEAWADYTGKYILTIVERPATSLGKAPGATTVGTAGAAKSKPGPAQAKTITAERMTLYGTHIGALTFTAQAMTLVGTHGGALIIDAAPLTLVGTHGGAVTLTAGAMTLVGTHAGPLSINTTPLTLVGNGGK
ncbi:MAG TPA: hypothetical protein VL199_06075 [Burkholderiales bacterium]|jgi:hypothetical protein|nr:hypothetical protein [Burkholderiales bacterium]